VILTAFINDFSKYKEFLFTDLKGSTELSFDLLILSQAFRSGHLSLDAAWYIQPPSAPPTTFQPKKRVAIRDSVTMPPQTS